MIDLHCHLLPGLDDGARDEAMAVEMARGLADLGFHTICCTPHLPWMGGPARADVDRAQERLGQAVRAAGLDLSLWPGAEHHASELMERVAAGRIRPYPRGDALLMEFSLQGLPAQLDQWLFRMQVKGLVPVVAHVERIPEVQGDLSILRDLRAKGCRLLINLTGLAGAWDRSAEKTARKVVEAGLADGASTDLHSPAELGLVEEGLRRLDGLVGNEGRARLTLRGPSEIAGPTGEGSA